MMPPPPHLLLPCTIHVTHAHLHSDLLKVSFAHAQITHTPTSSHRPRILPTSPLRLTHTQTHLHTDLHSDSVALRFTHTQTHLHSDRPSSYSDHSDSDPLILRLVMLVFKPTCHSHSDHSHSGSLILRLTHADWSQPYTLILSLAIVRNQTNSHS